MREILFRGKRIDNGEWAEGYYYKTYGCRNGIKRDAHFIHNYEDDENYEVDPETVCEYTTGLTDKNRRIFEGDIVKDDSAQLKGVIKFSERYLQFVVDDVDSGERDYSEFMKKVEVIGNIFDDPELLGEQGGNGIKKAYADIPKEVNDVDCDIAVKAFDVACHIAINALQELRQSRTAGTPEELLKMDMGED